ncbi:cell division protein DivIVA [Corynebacterium lujinxingii]|uniref:Cell division protein DivIVA n=1 Tax=Corynebacterium lujinxingii TaxID=2763010 RepID=A0A7H0K172_9CORY|nr:cell division protein DivIVA [Corynebacterium lujinxingii]MBC3178495.1 cell division protein DivIVA [Corynebacterium lujinxingii]NNO10573.1 cell division protein DivIVA [Corynebacterium lujinxingii]QNP91038.1 cell division protein DivIVA [Corynebacterium lujinxingii]
MLSWIILILVLILLSIIGVKLFATVFGRGEALPPMPPTAEVKEANRRAVEEGNFGDIQLEVVQRGYRMDQVDVLIEQLAGGALKPETRVESPEENVSSTNQ